LGEDFVFTLAETVVGDFADAVIISVFMPAVSIMIIAIMIDIILVILRPPFATQQLPQLTAKVQRNN
jgi:hypothetical protein